MRERSTVQNGGRSAEQQGWETEERNLKNRRNSKGVLSRDQHGSSFGITLHLVDIKFQIALRYNIMRN